MFFLLTGKLDVIHTHSHTRMQTQMHAYTFNISA